MVGFRMKQRLGWLRPLMIQPYYTYGNQHSLYVYGRVLEDRSISVRNEESSAWSNMMTIYHHFQSGEIPGATVQVRFQEQILTLHTDYEGFFEGTLKLAHQLTDDQLWHEVELELLTPEVRKQTNVCATSHVVVPPSYADFGVISDIDDTIVHTGATTLFKQARIILFNNATTRVPFPGVAAFYTALQQGNGNTPKNPVFYVSSSAWNMYQLFERFLDVHGLPQGPLLLRDFGLDAQKLIDTGHQDYKLKRIRPILETYPDLPFILIGDSGQEDADIYRQVVHEFPDRIKAIYIRDITPGKGNRTIQRITEELQQSGGVDVVLVEDTFAAAQHAVQNGFISSGTLEHIKRTKERDETM
ncbi:MAG: Phosphatidate phosphatase APP1 [Chloroflexi bacterium AL-W]|nr:Phosphatidate phosphatase APP1 [Chloroflexi bacterium AL-N1]NOK68115.1 Phosphatidate phosphatase APP1 [Chloroflexi bacterium AL-N10]NOK73455.1 Phosphatidate phosphatase APP1 [Chloroflexi bacterium AL-N5]NOK83369.1 Phosphatidate phosphatase APP1 [Chloroflexi bacterium AL-W]NOK87786.1 Phosphatidate phosphatase APP1 [Chloroflexi bacterium AL-N15]